MNKQMQQNIEMRGGKAAILDYIRERLPDIPILPYVVKQYGSDGFTVRDDFVAMDKPVIVRSSSPFEYANFEGIFDSFGGISDFPSLEDALHRVEASALSDRAKEYARQNGFTIDEKMHCMVQEQSNSQYTGAMMRHPNNPDIIFIQYFSGDREECDRVAVVYDEKTSSIKRVREIGEIRIDESELENLIHTYKQIEKIGIERGYSLVMEFGLEPFSLYQVRPFKKREKANFKIRGTGKAILKSDEVIGITPPEGIVLPVARSLGVADATDVAFELAYPRYGASEDCLFSKDDFSEEEWASLGLRLANFIDAYQIRSSLEMYGYREEFTSLIQSWHNAIERRSKGKGYCLALSSPLGNRYDIDLSVPNVRASIVGGGNFFLIHELTRLFKRSSVNILTNLLLSGFFRKIRSFDGSVRIVSNGKEAYVFKE